MRAVGEVMSIGKTYKEAFQKAIRSLETGRYGLGFAKDYNEKSKEELLRMLATPSSDRHFIMYEALRKGATVDEIFDITKVKPVSYTHLDVYKRQLIPLVLQQFFCFID